MYVVKTYIFNIPVQQPCIAYLWVRRELKDFKNIWCLGERQYVSKQLETSNKPIIPKIRHSYKQNAT